jgi:carbonic anhydrase
MKLLNHLFVNNKKWVKSVEAVNKGFFKRLAKQQSPEYLWIGCSDSRVPANEVVGLSPGELFVHRNVANIIGHTDFNCLSVLQFAVEVLKVKHIIVCGHYGCGGVTAALSNQKLGLIDNWLSNIKDIYHRHEEKFNLLKTEVERIDFLCELNVVEQVKNVCHTTIIQDAWDRGQELAVHGWIYGINDGLLKDLNACISAKNQIHEIYRVNR